MRQDSPVHFARQMFKSKAMVRAKHKKSETAGQIRKAPTGIQGLDQITRGGLPAERTTIVCGGPGCGKTMLGLEFLVRGAVDMGEPGVCMSFEESTEELADNFGSLGFDLKSLIARKKLFLDSVQFERSEMQETGEYNLDGLFIRLQDAIDRVGAKRVFLDTLEALFSGFANTAILRAEMRRLFRWLKDRRVTTIVTAERGTESLTRYGLEEYVSDCVIFLDHRVENEISTRRLRVVKYRGSFHGTNEYPFLIEEDGIAVLPVTAYGLQHHVGSQRVSSGIEGLDEMLEGKGFYRGSTILISGTAGTGKTSIASEFVNGSCARGEKCLYLSLEESVEQVVRNMKSIGLNLQPWIDKDLLRFVATRPTEFGLEMHLVRMYRVLESFKPKTVVVDPITNLVASGDSKEIRSMLMRLIDYLKGSNITGLFTSLTSGGHDQEQTEVGVSSLIDTWILLREIECNGERNRVVYVVKSRGMAHSNQVREFIMTNRGLRLIPAYLGNSGVLTGSARLSQEEREKEDSVLRQIEIDQHRGQLDRRRRELETNISALREAYELEKQQVERTIDLQKQREQRIRDGRSAMARSRRVAPSNGRSGGTRSGVEEL